MVLRSRQGAVNRPATVETLQDDAVIESSLTGPVSKNHGAPTERDSMVRAFVLDLHRLVHPVAVLCVVAAVVISPLDAVSTGRNRSHISKESREIQAPRQADGDASAAVVFVSLPARVLTSAFHVLPNAVLDGAFAAVRCVPLAQSLATQTATTRGPSIVNALRVQHAHLSTSATAAQQPRRIGWCVDFFEHGPSSKRLADQTRERFAFHHNLLNAAPFYYGWRTA